MIGPIGSIVLAWLFFAVTHIGMASAPVRGPLAKRFGEIGFGALFSLVAAVSFGMLCYVYSFAGSEGPAGPALGANPWLRGPLVLLSIVGVVCAFAALLDYPAGAYAVGHAGQQSEPRGFERISRHGFAVGISLVGLAHALLATHLSGTVFFGILFAFGILGSIHQDAKLLARNPSVHGAYLAKTSLVPFAAILSGRNRLVLSELRPLVLVLGVFAAWGIREAHPSIFAHGGLYVSGGTVAGAVLATLQVELYRIRRARRRRASGSVHREEDFEARQMR